MNVKNETPTGSTTWNSGIGDPSPSEPSMFVALTAKNP